MRGLKPSRDEKDQDSVSSGQAERSRQEEHLEETLVFSLGEGQWNKKTRVCQSQELWFLNKSFPFSYRSTFPTTKTFNFLEATLKLVLNFNPKAQMKP